MRHFSFVDAVRIRLLRAEYCSGDNLFYYTTKSDNCYFIVLTNIHRDSWYPGQMTNYRTRPAPWCGYLCTFALRQRIECSLPRLDDIGDPLTTQLSCVAVLSVLFGYWEPASDKHLAQRHVVLAVLAECEDYGERIMGQMPLSPPIVHLGPRNGPFS